MFLNLLVEVILILIITCGSYYGYRRGFFAMAIKPAKSVVRVGASISLCLPLGENLVEPILSPIIKRNLSSPVANILSKTFSILLAFFAVSVFFAFMLSIASGVIDLCINRGVLGRINEIVGMICATAISFFIAWIFITIFDYLTITEPFSGSRLVKEFCGGPIYKLLKAISPFS